ncbi:hypothetical protein PFLUV_G00053600 [Perca fluviatilis]|uniref:Uncharacterized protein n=1 Tax=Perca fluviatilis TaxID=8168 RepID=A0A6A5FC98_PERFL|nr:hypothetical protein PFLUV_G00053600 [Perca fluviatilis]
MPREAEAHPKLKKPEAEWGGGDGKECKVERKQVKVVRHGERKEGAYIGCPIWTRGHLRSLPACFGASAAQMYAFSLDPIVTHIAERNRVELTA